MLFNVKAVVRAIEGGRRFLATFSRGLPSEDLPILGIVHFEGYILLDCLFYGSQMVM
jgi:hypothetical protein